MNLIPSHNGPYVPAEGNKNARIMFIGHNADEESMQEGRPLAGRNGVRFDGLLTTFLKLERRDVYITNLLKYFPGFKVTVKKKEKLEWLPLLDEEIASVNPEIVVILGAPTLKFFFHKMNMKSSHGKPFLCPDGALAGRVVVPWYAPAAGARDQAMFRDSIVDAAEFWENIELLDQVKINLDYDLVHADEALIEMMSHEEVGFDLETTAEQVGRRKTFNNIVGYSVSGSPYRGVYTPDSIELVANELEGPRKIICHNTKFEINRLAEHRCVVHPVGIKLRNFEDTRGIAYLLGYSDTTLKGLAKQLLNCEPENFKDTTKGVDLASVAEMTQCMIDHFEYGAADSDNTRRLYYILLEQLQEAGLEEVYRTIELPLTPVLAHMERVGIHVDFKAVGDALTIMDERIEVSRQLVAEHLYKDINLNSDRQVSDALVHAGCPLTVLVESKEHYSVAKEHLQEKKVHDWNPKCIDGIMRYKEFYKLRQFLLSFKSLADENNKIHPQYNQYGSLEELGGNSSAAPRTGRLSASSPNIQNIPNYSNAQWGKAIRACLIPKEGWVWVKADFAQQEARIVSVVADDENLMYDFENQVDVYSVVAAALYNRERWQDVFKYERQTGKTFFLAWSYGAGADKVRQIDRKVSQHDSVAGLVRLRRRYPGVARYAADTEKSLRDAGYVTTLFGRKRFIPGIFSPNKYLQAQAIRQGVNARIQGTGADVVKKMLIKVANEIDWSKAHIIATVHDELDFECEPTYLPKLMEIVRRHAASILPGVVLPVDFEQGPDWGHVVEIT
jgi:DNA polymerase-1|tara:strand:+ start:7970 stop:10327 length:2358 start_codon:yes stop_codon:yes gene_type:complete